MNSAQMVQWRCRSCGVGLPLGEAECQCGIPRPSSDQRKSKLLSAILSNEGNSLVQNNVSNVAVHGNVTIGNFFTESVEEDEEEERRRPALPPPGPTPLQRVFMFVCSIFIALCFVTMALFVAFFIAIVVKAFFLH